MRMQSTIDNPKWFAPSTQSPSIHRVRYWEESQTLDISLKGHFFETKVSYEDQGVKP